MSSKVYVEGGGDTRVMRTECRKAFSMFFNKAGLMGHMPRVFACGARQHAYREFCNAIAEKRGNEFIILLVDSEGPVAEGAIPWTYLKSRDNWDRPDGADDNNAHLMVQCMESWFLADKGVLVKFFGQGFNQSALPARLEIEEVSKADLERGLKNATRQSKQKGAYHKGRHSFAILAELNPEQVTNASPHAKRLVSTLQDRSSGPKR